MDKYNFKKCHISVSTVERIIYIIYLEYNIPTAKELVNIRYNFNIYINSWFVKFYFF